VKNSIDYESCLSFLITYNIITFNESIIANIDFVRKLENIDFVIVGWLLAQSSFYNKTQFHL
jgi:hypothetical protein